MKFRSLLALGKYPSYVVDSYVRFVLQLHWRRQGIKLGDGILWLGKPIISLATGSLISIGEKCLMCSRSSQTALGVNHPVILRTLFAGAELFIGARVRMSGATICAAERVVIGNRCVMGANVMIADTDFHALDPAVRSSPEDARAAAHKPIEIGDDVFIGGNSIILKGVTIGKGAVIGAGSVVTQNVEDRTVVAGNPALRIRVVECGDRISKPGQWL